MLNRDIVSEKLKMYKPLLKEKYFVSKIRFLAHLRVMNKRTIEQVLNEI